MAAVNPKTIQEWIPKSPKQEELKGIISNFNGLPKSLLKTARGSDDRLGEERDVFIMRNWSNFDLQAYAYSGLKLPSSESVFAAIYPADECQKLSEVDGGIYGITQDTVVKVYETCDDFTKNTLPILNTLTDQTLTFCHDAILRIDGEALKGQMATLLQDKYKEPDNRDDAFDKAFKATKLLLEDLASVCDDKNKQAEALSGDFQTFGTKVATNKTSVEFLVKEYKTGPVVDSRTGEPTPDQEPYATWLHEELEKLREQIRKDIAARDEAYDNWKHDTIVAATAVTYAFCPPVSATVLGIYTAKAIQERNNYDQLKKKVDDENKELKTLNDLLTYINGLVIQFDDLEMKVGAAQDAIQEVCDSFGKQATNFANAIDSFGFAEDIIDTELFGLTELIQETLQDSVHAFVKIQELAQEFRDTPVEFNDV